MFPPRWKYFHRGGNVSTAVIIISTAVIIISICACSCGRVCARAYVFARVRVSNLACVREAAHMSVYGLCMCGRACVCACGCVRVFMRACMRACLRASIYVCMIIVLYYYCGAR